MVGYIVYHHSRVVKRGFQSNALITFFLKKVVKFFVVAPITKSCCCHLHKTTNKPTKSEVI